MLNKGLMPEFSRLVKAIFFSVLDNGNIQHATVYHARHYNLCDKVPLSNKSVSGEVSSHISFCFDIAAFSLHARHYLVSGIKLELITWPSLTVSIHV